MQAHVLIVDDDEAMRESLVFALERANKWWTISVADGVRQARQIIESPPAEAGPVDIVLTDLVMDPQEGGGIEVLEIAKQKDPFMMVIVFTAQEKELDRFEAYKHGAFDCVEKNIIGRQAWKEISVKANAAINFRHAALKQLDDQKRINILRRFFDPRVFQAIRDDPSLLGLKLRPSTIVFWDIRNFSKICNNLGTKPELLREFLFEYYTVATEAIFENHGILDKFIGDGIMALFFSLRPEDDDGTYGAAHSVNAAVSLAQGFDLLMKKWSMHWNFGGGSFDIGLSCGIHTGKSLVGNLGTAMREHFTAIGPNVNYAARLEKHARSGQILVSDVTARFLTNSAKSSAAAKALLQKVELKYLGVISNVKNIPGEHRVFEVKRKLQR